MQFIGEGEKNKLFFETIVPAEMFRCLEIHTSSIVEHSEHNMVISLTNPRHYRFPVATEDGIYYFLVIKNGSLDTFYNLSEWEHVPTYAVPVTSNNRLLNHYVNYNTTAEVWREANKTEPATDTITDQLVYFDTEACKYDKPSSDEDYE